MAEILILNETVPVAFAVAEDATLGLDQPALLAGLEEMSALIRSIDWPEPYADAFDGLRGIVFFEGAVEVNGYMMDRPGMDEDDAVFYWEGNEFTANPDPRVHASTLFHDCWHVVQFKARGYARSTPERVDRELDAIQHQLIVSGPGFLDCDSTAVRFLIDYRDDQTRIRDRLAEGVGRVSHA